ncbi:MAG: META domain-containing protein [Actinomycetota bacterium]
MRRALAFLALIGLATCGVGCSSSGDAGRLAGAWSVEEVVGGPAFPPGTDPEVRFSTAQQEMDGTSGCNSFGSDYTADGNGSLSFGPIESTAIGCPEPVLAVEASLFDALGVVDGYVFDGTMLVLTDEEDAPLLRLDPIAAEAAG